MTSDTVGHRDRRLAVCLDVVVFVRVCVPPRASLRLSVCVSACVCKTRSLKICEWPALCVGRLGQAYGVVSFINTIFAVHAGREDFMNEQGRGRAVPRHAGRPGRGSKVLSPAAVEAVLSWSPALPTQPGTARCQARDAASERPSIASLTHSYSPSLGPSPAELCALRSIEFSNSVLVVDWRTSQARTEQDAQVRHR